MAPLLISLLILAAPTDDELAKAVFPKGGEKLTGVVRTPTPEGLVVVLATEVSPPISATATVALLEPTTLRVLSRTAVTMDSRTMGEPTPAYGARLLPPLTTAAKPLFAAEVGFKTDGMGSKMDHVFFAVI